MGTGETTHLTQSRGVCNGTEVWKSPGEVGEFGRTSDHSHRGPRKSPSNVKDQVRLSGDVEIRDKDWEWGKYSHWKNPSNWVIDDGILSPTLRPVTWQGTTDKYQGVYRVGG